MKLKLPKIDWLMSRPPLRRGPAPDARRAPARPPVRSPRPSRSTAGRCRSSSRYRASGHCSSPPVSAQCGRSGSEAARACRSRGDQFGQQRVRRVPAVDLLRMFTGRRRAGIEVVGRPGVERHHRNVLRRGRRRSGPRTRRSRRACPPGVERRDCRLGMVRLRHAGRQGPNRVSVTAPARLKIRPRDAQLLAEPAEGARRPPTPRTGCRTWQPRAAQRAGVLEGRHFEQLAHTDPLSRSTSSPNSSLASASFSARSRANGLGRKPSAVTPKPGDPVDPVMLASRDSTLVRSSVVGVSDIELHFP